MSTWILLRGWTREARHWGRFPGELAAALPGAKILAADLPGNGSLSEQRSPSSVPAIVEALRGSVPVERPLYVLGLSLGGMVAMEWACRHPAEVAGCVLINTSVRPFSPFYRRLRAANYAALVRLLLLERDVEAREARILALTSAAAPSATLVSDWARYAREFPVRRANALRQVMAAARYRAPLSPPSVPLLVLASRGDALVDWRCSEALARRWGAPLEVHASAGHDLALDDGAWVAERVAGWRARRG
jgi:pimeloyl-ACP methyl ester carboxylesterase